MFQRRLVMKSSKDTNDDVERIEEWAQDTSVAEAYFGQEDPGPIVQLYRLAVKAFEIFLMNNETFSDTAAFIPHIRNELGRLHVWSLELDLGLIDEALNSSRYLRKVVWGRLKDTVVLLVKGKHYP